MAKKQVTPKESDKGGNGSTLPEGFRQLQGERGGAWWKPEVGAILRGVLKGRFPRTNGKGFYYQILLTAPTTAQVPVKDGDGYEAGTVDVGKIVNVDERADLQCLAAIADGEDTLQEVYLQAMEKLPIKGGKTFWRFQAGVREIQESDLPF